MAAIFFVVGLHLLGVIPMPWSGPGQVNMKRKGLLAAFILGPGVRHCARSVHVRLHGADAGGDVQAGGDQCALRRVAAAGLRRGTLLGDRAGGHVHGSRAAVPELERAIQGRRRS